MGAPPTKGKQRQEAGRSTDDTKTNLRGEVDRQSGCCHAREDHVTAPPSPSIHLAHWMTGFFGTWSMSIRLASGSNFNSNIEERGSLSNLASYYNITCPNAI